MGQIHDLPAQPPPMTEIEEARAKVDLYLEAYHLLKTIEPKTAATLLGKAHPAALEYARLSGRGDE